MTFIQIAYRVRLAMALVFLTLLSHAQYQETNFVPVAPDALSSSFVRCVYKDSHGYVWIGTSDGLIRYDGVNTYRYENDPSDERTITNNNINVIMEDPQQNLWVGTSRGLNIYDRNLDHFTQLHRLPELKNLPNHAYITALSFDRQGKAWIGTHGGGVNVYDPHTFTFTYLVDPTDGKVSSLTNYVNSMRRVDDLLFCGTKGGLKVFNSLEKAPVSLNFIDDALPTLSFTQVANDKAGNVWLLSSEGQVIRLEPRNGYYTFTKIFDGQKRYGAEWNNVLALALDPKGNFWIGGENVGLNYFDAGEAAITRFPAHDSNPKKLPTNSIRSVYIDSEGLVWVGTFNKGLYMVDNQSKKFMHYDKGVLKDSDLMGKDVRSFAEDRDGNIWIAFEGTGLRKIDAETNLLQRCDDVNERLPGKFLTSLVCDRHNNLWIGTAGDGMYKLNLNTQALDRYTLRSGGFGDDKIYCLYEDKKGKIWAGLDGSGLFYFDETENAFVHLCESKKETFITKTTYVSSIVEDFQGTLWVGTMYGLYALEETGENTYHYEWHMPNGGEGSLRSPTVQTLHEDKFKNLWVGTTDNGLSVKRRDAAGFEFLGREHGLPSNIIRSVITDATGNLWVSTNMGLSKLDRAGMKFTNYTREDGLVSNNFYQNASLRSSSGELLFGSNNGFNAFYPDSIGVDTALPEVRLTGLQVNNQPVEIGAKGSPLHKHISLTDEINLSYQQRSLKIDFVAINYRQPYRHQYCYRLEGFDKDWNCVGNLNSAIYTNLDPGTYTFWVKASNSDGIWSEAPAQLKISIAQAPWKTPWAIALYVAVLGGVAYFLVKTWVERMKMRHQLVLERLAREREQELSESKTQFFTHISHEFRTPLSLMLMPLEGLIMGENVPSNVKERVYTAYRSADKMKRLVNELMDFNRMEGDSLQLNLRYGDLGKAVSEIASFFDDLAIRKNIHFTVKQEVPVLQGWFDPDKLEKVLANLLSNAFKFTGRGGKISVRVGIKHTQTQLMASLGRCLEIAVVDNGMGISQEEIPRIFDKFYQAKSAKKISSAGTGIGLSLAKGLVELHRGDIAVASIPGIETRFTVVLPVEAPVNGVGEGRDVPADVFFLEAEEKTRAVEESGARAGTELGNKPTILLVEDNDDLREYLAAELRACYTVYEACDGQEGIQVAFDKGPDLIVSDILMQNKDGIELCRAIKTDVRTSHIPVILLTAKATMEDQIVGIDTGADAYITKPFSLRFLLTHVRNMIESRQKLYSQFSQDVYLLPARLASGKIDQAFLQKAIDFIVSNIQDSQLSVDTLAEMFSLSRMQVYRKIKALTGKSVVDFIRTVRIKEALKLMNTQQYTLSEIAFQTGFNSASYFTRCFKDQFGKAPSEYLESNKPHI